MRKVIKFLDGLNLTKFKNVMGRVYTIVTSITLTFATIIGLLLRNNYVHTYSKVIFSIIILELLVCSLLFTWADEQNGLTRLMWLTLIVCMATISLTIIWATAFLD